MTIEALFFDFGGTLDADGVPWKDRFLRLFREAGVAVEDETFFQAYYAADDPIVERGDASAGYAETVGELAAGLARTLDREELGHEVADRFLADSQARITANLQILRDLGERYRLGIISNFYGNLANACRETGLDQVMEVAVDSERVGHGKPHPAIFRHALDALGLEADQAVMIGDSLPRDIGGARALGMPYLLLLRADAAAPPAEVPADRVIHSLAEVAEALA